MNFEISETLRKEIPSLREEEKNELERKLLAEGFDSKKYGSLIIAKLPDGKLYLADGHNRFEICKKHNLDYTVQYKEFKDIDSIKIWMWVNQFAKRNLNDEWIAYYIGKLYKAEKKNIGEHKGNQYTKMESDQNDHFPKQEKTSEKIAKEKGMSAPTVRRNETFSDNVDKIVEETGIDKSVILDGKLSKEDINTLAKQETLTEKKKEIIEKVTSGEVKTVKDAVKEQRKEEKIEEIKEKAKSNIIPNYIKLLEGDLFDLIDQIENESVDLLNTDPPYMVIEEEWDQFENKEKFLSFTENWLKKVVPKVKKTGRIYISFAHDYKFDLYNLLQKNNFFDFIFCNEIIWYYKNNNKPFDRTRYRFAYEPIFYLRGKESKLLNFTNETFGEMQQNVWEIATPQSNFNEGKFHSAQKPLELYRRIIMTGSFENNTVLDCFAGSGTTGIICKELKRNCILIERDKDNIEIIKGRL